MAHIGCESCVVCRMEYLIGGDTPDDLPRDPPREGAVIPLSREARRVAQTVDADEIRDAIENGTFTATDHVEETILAQVHKPGEVRAREIAELRKWRNT